MIPPFIIAEAVIFAALVMFPTHFLPAISLIVCILQKVNILNSLFYTASVVYITPNTRNRIDSTMIPKIARVEFTCFS